MTRAEDEEVRSYYNRKYYLNRREAVIAYQKKYAKEHKEHINAMQRERRRRKALGSTRRGNIAARRLIASRQHFRLRSIAIVCGCARSIARYPSSSVLSTTISYAARRSNI